MADVGHYETSGITPEWRREIGTYTQERAERLRAGLPIHEGFGVITDAVQSERPDDQQLSHWLPWRTGRKVGRTIYAQVGAEPSDDDALIGMMDSAVLANEAVTAHNAALRSAQKP